MVDLDDRSQLVSWYDKAGDLVSVDEYEAMIEAVERSEAHGKRDVQEVAWQALDRLRAKLTA